MADQPVQISIKSATSTAYPCCFLPKELGIPDDQRKAYIQIPAGHRPGIARLWMDGVTFNAAKAAGIIANSPTFPLSIIITAPQGNSASPATMTVSQVNTRHCWSVQSAMVAYDGIDNVIYQVILTTAQWKWGSDLTKTKSGIPGLPDYFNRTTFDGRAFLPSKAAGGIVPLSSTTAQTASDTWDQMFAKIITDTGAFNSPTWPAAIDGTQWKPINLSTAAPYQYLIRWMLESVGYQLVADVWEPSNGNLNFPFLTIVKLDGNATDFNGQIRDCYRIAGHSGYNETFPPFMGTPFVANPHIDNLSPIGLSTFDVAFSSQLTPFPQDNNYISPPGRTSDPVSGTCPYHTEPYSTFDNYAGVFGVIPPHIVVLAGCWNHKPGRNVRKVEISFDLDGVYTTLWTHPYYEDCGALVFESAGRGRGSGFTMDGQTPYYFANGNPYANPAIYGMARSGPPWSPQFYPNPCTPMLTPIGRLIRVLPHQSNEEGNTYEAGIYDGCIVEGDITSALTFDPTATNPVNQASVGLAEITSVARPDCIFINSNEQDYSSQDHEISTDSNYCLSFGFFIGYYQKTGGSGVPVFVGCPMNTGKSFVTQSAGDPSWNRGQMRKGIGTSIYNGTHTVELRFDTTGRLIFAQTS